MDNTLSDGSSSSPSQSNFEILDYDFLPQEWTLDALRQSALQQRLARPRSLGWAIMLHALPSAQGDVISSITTHRNYYNDLKAKLSMDPRAVIGDDPLSQDDESVWKQHFCDNELKAIIMQDVVRTFPDELYFRDQDVQDMMVRILFFWARSHAHVGYRQGMHEILAPVLFELFQDRRFAPRDVCDVLKCFLDDDYLEHDSYMLFNAVMKGLERFYSTGDVVPSKSGRLPTSKVVHNPNEVVRYLDKVKEEFLVPLDHELAAHLHECNITMELFGIRWLRLLFGREFPRGELAHLWGFLFADGPALPHLHFVVLAMLISIRTTLLESEAGGALSALMRPSPVSVGHVCALALHLRAPLSHPRPAPPRRALTSVQSPVATSTWALEQTGASHDGDVDSGSEGVPEGGDVARELAALALLRARLPNAASALAAALPRPPPHIAQPLQQILQLAALLQCRNHALIDVETALEAAEGHSTDKVGKRQLVPVSMIPKRSPAKQPIKIPPKVKEVPLKVFHQVECKSTSDLPFLDPLRLRTE
ncbi:TBC1 domain family member 5 isoform X1 [Ostrinia furnacalis]|uniref:TBC1 domain family member 5 isoform X1 n=1 Tax=Ostrinia furnacalis TaxID=93504 RepID=UPI00103F9006|nr:TBC1 domain family member 5 isoform X1 [Ostrinia furnacalis]